MSAILILLMSVSAFAAPIAEVEELRDNRDGTATLTIVCTTGAKVKFTAKVKQLDGDVDGIFAIIQRECKKGKP